MVYVYLFLDLIVLIFVFYVDIVLEWEELLNNVICFKVMYKMMLLCFEFFYYKYGSV